jgi:hypothetical protein
MRGLRGCAGQHAVDLDMSRVRYFHSMTDHVADYVLSGLTDNSDIARILGDAYDMPITAADVRRWRQEHRRFNAMCVNAHDHLTACAVGVVARAIKDGSTSDAWRYLERTNPRFKPSQKVDHGGRIEGLADMLARRMSEDDLKDQGVLEDDSD